MNVVQRRRFDARRRKRRSALPWWAIAILVLATLASLAAVIGVGVAYSIYQGYADDYVPIEEKLRQTNIGLTEIYDRGGPEQGVLLGHLTNQDAQLLNPVPLDEIHKWVIEATVSTEDNSFFSNPGINLSGLARASWEYVRGGFDTSVGTGGSSITQQLIKNVYICPNIGDEQTRCTSAERTVDRKLREIVYAIELNEDYSKEQILEWYLNQTPYADRYVGIQAAAKGYFRVDASQLSLAQAALLAGIPAFPTLYHPRLNCVRDANQNCVTDELGRTTVTGPAKERQEVVLDLMRENGRATAEEVAAAKAEPLLIWPRTNPIRAAAFIDNQVEPRLVRMCEFGIIPRRAGSADCASSISSAGYKVTTTLDYRLTEQARSMINDFVTRGIDLRCECYNGAIATIEPSTGQIIIYAENRDPANLTDRRIAGDIDQLNEINQPGSSFKPAVYLAWMDTLGKTPGSILWDTSPMPVEGTVIVNPRPGGGGEGIITARAALGGSQNIGAFRAAQEAGVDNVIAIAKKLGITTLEQNFDPTFRAHEDVTYGASIATGGANIRAIDMAYMNSVIANMGVMVGVPTYAEYRDHRKFKSTAVDTGADYDLAREQALAFSRGHIRVQGTRELDPVVILEIRDIEGNVIFRQGEPERRQVVDAGSVWMLHSIMSDCTARFIIWGCGTSNDDLRLDFILDGARVPSGVKTGTQQGPKSADETLETWMTGYSRYAATAVWIGNATNELVQDGPRVDYASANTTVWLWKNWMSAYHSHLKSIGIFETPAGFDSVRPANVAQRAVISPHTERGAPGGCDQTIGVWVRTDVRPDNPCVEAEIDTRNGLLASDATPAQFRAVRKFVRLPSFKADLAVALAREKGIPIVPTERSSGQAAVAITTPTNGSFVIGDTQVIGSVGVAGLRRWTLELGAGSVPSEWKTIGSGTSPVTSGALGTIEIKDLQEGTYTIRLTADASATGPLSTSISVNIRKGPGTATPSATVSGTPGTRTPTPPGGARTPTPTPTSGSPGETQTPPGRGQ